MCLATCLLCYQSILRFMCKIQSWFTVKQNNICNTHLIACGFVTLFKAYHINSNAIQLSSACSDSKSLALLLWKCYSYLHAGVDFKYRATSAQLMMPSAENCIILQTEITLHMGSNRRVTTYFRHSLGSIYLLGSWQNTILRLSKQNKQISYYQISSWKVRGNDRSAARRL